MNSTTRASTPPKRSANDESVNSHADKRGRHEAEVRAMPSADETRGTCTCEHPDLPDDTSQADAVSGRHIEINGPDDMSEYAVRVGYINRPIPAGLYTEEYAVKTAVDIVGARLDQCILCNIDQIDEMVRDARKIIRKTAIAVATARDEKLISCNLDGAVDDELPRYNHYVAEAAIFKVDNPILRFMSHDIPELPPFLCFEANSLADILVAVLSKRELAQFKAAVLNPDSLKVDPSSTAVATLVQGDPITNEIRIEYTDTAVVKLVGMTDHPVVKAFVDTLVHTEEDDDDN